MTRDELGAAVTARCRFRHLGSAFADGIVAGTWSATGERAAVTWFPEAGQPPRAALAEQVERLATILARPLQPAIRVA